MRVFVDTKFGETFTIDDLDRYSKVLDIKKEVEESEGIPVSTQTLFFNGVELAVDHHSLTKCRIGCNSRLLLELRDSHVNNQILQQSPYATQGFVPPMAPTSSRVPPSDSLLREPYDTLGDFLFGGDDPLFSTEAFTDILSHWPTTSATEAIANENHKFQTEKSTPPQKLTLIMTQYDKPGRKFLFEVNARDNVEELKKELEYQLDLPPEGYFLLHKERVLDDDKSFIINRVADGDTIEIFPGPDIEDCHT